MIFAKQHCQMILDGTKTQIRRVVKPWENTTEGTAGDIGYVCTGISMKWAVGKTYAIQPGVTAYPVGRFRLTSIEKRLLHDLTADDVQASGIDVMGHLPMMVNPGTTKKQLEDFILWTAKRLFAEEWNMNNHKHPWSSNPCVWVLGLEVVQ